MRQVLVNQSARPAQLVAAGEGPYLIYNTDSNNTIVLGDDIGMNANRDTVVPLGPLAVVVVNGAKDVYALPQVPNQSILVSLIPGGLNFFQLLKILVKTLIISASAGNGEFVYNPSPGLGNLVAAITAVTSVLPQTSADTYGNNYFNGIFTQNPSTSGYVNMAGGFIFLGKIGEFAGANLFSASGELALSSDQITSLDTAASLTLMTPGNINNLIGAPASAFFKYLVALNPNGSGNTETWHNLGAPIAGWTVAGRARYKLLADSGLVLVELQNIQLPGAPPADNTTIWTAANGLPAGYRPAVASGRNPCYFNGGAGGETPSWAFNTDGSIVVFGVGGTTIARLDCPYLLMPTI